MKIAKISSFGNYQYKKNIKNENKAHSNNAKDAVSFQGVYYQPNVSYEPTFELSIVDKDFELSPKCKYIVDGDTSLLVGKDVILKFQDEDMSGILNSAYPNVPLVFGKEGLLSNRFSNYVSRKHFQVTKTTNGKFILKDLNSTNGTRVLKNVVDFDKLNPNQKLLNGVKYQITPNSVLSLGHDCAICLNEYLDKLNMNDGDSIVIGRGRDCNLVYDEEHVSRHHLKVTKHNGKLFAQDLNSSNGTYYCYEHTTNSNFNDFSKITDIAMLQPNKPTIIPDDCQIILGDDFVFDIRNSNITSLLDEVDSITIGRSSDCDINIEGFYGKASNIHLELSKVNDKYVVRDLDSSNGTKIVPKSKIKPFYKGVENLELEQGNVGDCYLLASIYSLSKHPQGAKIIESMVKVDDCGNYIVSLPNTEPILVKPNELDGQANKDKVKRSVTGELGIKAIERAYAKSIKLGSDKTMFAQIDDGGFTHIALNNISGVFSNRVDVRPDSDLGVLMRDFERQGLNNFVFTCGTRYSDDDYIDPDCRFVSSHAYSIVGVDTRDRILTLANPHHTKDKIEVSFDDFCKYFDNVSYTDMRKSFFF